MDDLPPELLNLIAEQCLVSSLKNLRLVGQKYCDASNPVLFEHFCLGIFDESINQLIALSKSKLAKYVKRCTVCLDHLPQWTYKHWEHAVYMKGSSHWSIYGDGPDPHSTRVYAADYPGSGCHLCHHLGSDAPVHHELFGHFSPGRLYDAFQDFRCIVTQQMQWLTAGYGIPLKECLAMLPNLSAVTCTPTFMDLTQESQLSWSLWNRLQHKLLLTPKDWAMMNSRGGSYERDDDVQFVRRVSFYIFGSIAFRASFSGTKPITQLELHISQQVYGSREARKYSTWESVMTRRTRHSLPLLDQLSYRASFARILDGFQYLTHIDWCISSPELLSFDRSFLTKETLMLFRGCKNLRSLCLSFYERAHARQVPGLAIPGDAAIDKLLEDDPQWLHLRHLRLSFRASHIKLLALFKALSTTLRSIELIDMEIGDAQELINGIPEILQLEKVQLNSIWHTWESSGIQCLFPEGLYKASPLEKDVREFLLRQRDDCPALGLY